MYMQCILIYNLKKSLIKSKEYFDVKDKFQNEWKKYEECYNFYFFPSFPFSKFRCRIVEQIIRCFQINPLSCLDPQNIDEHF